MKTFVHGFAGGFAGAIALAILLIVLTGFQGRTIKVVPEVYFNGHQVPFNDRIDVYVADGLHVSCSEGPDPTLDPKVKTTQCFLGYYPSPDDAHRVEEQGKQYHGSTSDSLK